jgi:hypothetical protein
MITNNNNNKVKQQKHSPNIAMSYSRGKFYLIGKFFSFTLLPFFSSNDNQSEEERRIKMCKIISSVNVETKNENSKSRRVKISLHNFTRKKKIPWKIQEKLSKIFIKLWEKWRTLIERSGNKENKLPLLKATFFIAKKRKNLHYKK